MENYWGTYEGRMNEAIRRGLRDAGVKGQLAHLVAPILVEVLKVAPSPPSHEQPRPGANRGSTST